MQVGLFHGRLESTVIKRFVQKPVTRGCLKPVGLSLVVLYGVRTRQIKYLVYAILLHTLVNAPPVILLERGAN
ncbi:MAG TPA: YhfC family intramembrane metalloprotease, partial [Hydrogenispora sp.]|nr:YhfC family intramembrane metalloprotease [Hydrogenispora sp.]